MKVNLAGLLRNVASSIPRAEREHADFCLQEVYGHINDVIQGRHTLAEFAEHYCLPPPPTPSATVPDEK